MAFSADFVTEEKYINISHDERTSDPHTLASRLVGLLNGFDDTDSHGLPHVTDGETTKWGVLVVRFNTENIGYDKGAAIFNSKDVPHGFGGDELSNASITRLDEFRGSFNGLSTPTIDLLDELGELAGDVGSMAIEDGGVTGTNLTWVVEDDDLSVKRSGFLGGVILRVGCNISTTNILDRDVPAKMSEMSQQRINSLYILDVETDVVTWKTLNELLVVHFDGFHFSSNIGGSKSDDHSSLDDSSFNTTNRYSSNTTDSVDILERKTERFVGRSHRWFNGINGVEQSLAFDRTTFVLLRPALVPQHAIDPY